jgi:hypothetical protein
MKPIRVRQGVVLGGAIVVTKYLLVNVPLKMIRLDGNVGAFQSAL